MLAFAGFCLGCELCFALICVYLLGFVCLFGCGFGWGCAMIDGFCAALIWVLRCFDLGFGLDLVLLVCLAGLGSLLLTGCFAGL